MERIYTNVVVINGVEYTNTIKALNYKDALAIFKTVYQCKKENENSYSEITKIEFDYFNSLT